MVALRPGSWCMFVVLVLLGTLSSSTVVAQERGQDASLDETHRAQVERLRGEIANQMQLQAYDLLDELVFGWMEKPPFGTPTPVVLGDVVAPVGFGSGLEALLENHLAELLLRNPETNVQLAHCPACQAFTVHSDKQATIMGRGFDHPKALARVRGDTGAQHVLFIDVEAEGSTLVLRARMTQLNENLPIVFARTLSTSISSAALLRKPDELKSAQAARDEYLAVLEGRGRLSIPVKLVIGALAPSNTQPLAVPTPVPWLQVGVEMALTSARAWSGSLVVGGSFIPNFHTAIMVQARVHRLLTGSTFSMTRPNVYGFIGVNLNGFQGTTATLLSPPTEPNPLDILSFLNINGSLAAYPGLQAGLEVRINNRIGAAVFVEGDPTLQELDGVGDWLQTATGGDWGIFQINTIGVETSFAF